LLDHPHPVRSGIGITFRYLASVSVEDNDQRGPFTVYAAGAEYDAPTVLVEHLPPHFPLTR
jgi:hypothetical protein